MCHAPGRFRGVLLAFTFRRPSPVSDQAEYRCSAVRFGPWPPSNHQLPGGHSPSTATILRLGYQWSAGVQRLLPHDFVVSVDYSANRSTHLSWGSFAAGTRNRNFIPRCAGRITPRSVEQSRAESVPVAFVGPNAIFNEPDSRYNDAEIPLVNLLRPFPQFDGEFFGVAFGGRTFPLRLNAGSVRKAARAVLHDSGQLYSRPFHGQQLFRRQRLDRLVTIGGPQALDRLSNENTLSANNATHRLAAAFTAKIPVGRGLARQQYEPGGRRRDRRLVGLVECHAAKRAAGRNPDVPRSSFGRSAAAQRDLCGSGHGSEQ